MKRIVPGDRISNGRLSQAGDSFRILSGGNRRVVAVFRCDCGENVIRNVTDVKRGHTTSCGCFHIATITKHGHTAKGKRSVEYATWASMHDRCKKISNNPSTKSYRDSGIEVCERWNSFEFFLEDMGERPLGCTLDRKDGNGNYEPGNCRWATPLEQARNTKANKNVTFNDRVMCVSEFAKTIGMNRNTVEWRLKSGMSPKQISETPLKR